MCIEGSQVLLSKNIVFLSLKIYFVLANIGVAPISQPTHVRDKNSNIQGRSPNVVKVTFHTIRKCS